MTMNGYLSEGHGTAKDVILTIVHTSCNSRQGNKCRQQSAPKLEALSRLTYTHTPTHHGYHQTLHLDQTVPL